MQRVDIQFCPAEEGGNYLSIRATLQRKSGEAAIWHRINTVFLHDLRKQLLVWRALDKDAHDQLRSVFQNITAKKNIYPEAI